MYNTAYLIKGITILFLAISCCPILNAQDFKLDKVTLKDVEKNIYTKDTAAFVVILFKYRQTYFETNKHGEWDVITEISKRVKILKKEGFQFGIEKIKLKRTR